MKIDMPRRLEKEIESNPYARRMAILEIIYSASGPVRTGELTSRFNIESNLLAYDLQRLEELGLVERGFGWVRKRALEVENLFPESAFASRLGHEAKAKQAIAKYIAEELIPPGAQVALDAGTTAYFVAKALIEKAKSVSIWTNNIPLFLYAASRSEMPCHLLGGELDRTQAALSGDTAAREAARVRFDLAVLVPGGALLLDLDKIQESVPVAESAGIEEKSIKCIVTLFNEDPKQLGYKRAIALNANRVIIPLTKCKFRVVGFPFLHFLLYERTALGAVRTRGAVFARPAWQSETEATSVSRLEPAAAEKPKTVDLRLADEITMVTDATPAEVRELCPDGEKSIAWAEKAGVLRFLNIR